eukprot:6179624-Pleurochrysis_carterae.AAC.2
MWCRADYDSHIDRDENTHRYRTWINRAKEGSHEVDEPSLRKSTYGSRELRAIAPRVMSNGFQGGGQRKRNGIDPEGCQFDKIGDVGKRTRQAEEEQMGDRRARDAHEETEGVRLQRGLLNQQRYKAGAHLFLMEASNASHEPKRRIPMKAL